MQVEFLADHINAIPKLSQWFFDEWAEYYKPKGVHVAAADLLACCRWEEIPLGLVAVDNKVVWGTGAIKPTSLTTHKHLGPWLTAFLVAPSKRGQGIGRILIEAIELQAHHLGFSKIYAGTSTSMNLFERAEWDVMECVEYHEQMVTVFQKDLSHL